MLYNDRSVVHNYEVLQAVARFSRSSTGKPMTSQEQLRERLRARGIEATQATLSRDIRDLGLDQAAG